VTGGTAFTAVDSNSATSHNFLLSNLATSTPYYYVVTSTDSSGNIATSTQGTFTTLSQ
jgi:hypothetical protein